jgi:hypothetical protein
MPRVEFRGRQASVYFSSLADKARWEKWAKERGITLSRFIYEIVEDAQSKGKDTLPSELIKNIADLKEENKKLREEVKLKSLVLEKYETELYRLRYGAFANVDSEGRRKLDEELVTLLKRGRPITGNEILEALKIDPRDSSLVQLVYNQLEGLSRYGLAKETANKWRWTA